jgi:hypothetical protein
MIEKKMPVQGKYGKPEKRPHFTNCPPECIRTILHTVCVESDPAHESQKYHYNRGNLKDFQVELFHSF